MKAETLLKEAKNDSQFNKSPQRLNPNSETPNEHEKKSMKPIAHFFFGIFIGFFLNFIAVAFVFCIKSKNFVQGCFVGFIYFCFFALLIGMTYYIYNFSGISD